MTKIQNILYIPTSGLYSTSSKHDTKIIQYAVLTNVKGPAKNTQTDWSILKTSLYQGASTITIRKHLQAILPAKTDGSGKTKNNILERTCLMLDFDDVQSIDQIAQELKGYVYIAWTTHSHQTPEVNYKNRYRILLPFNSPISSSQWDSDIKLRLDHWVDQRWPVQNKVDKSCLELAQIGFSPATNGSSTNTCQLWVNDGWGTAFLDVNTLPTVSTSTQPAKQSIQKNIQSSPQKVSNLIDPDTLIDILKRKTELYDIHANNFTGPGAQYTRLYIAAALNSLGVGYLNFRDLDDVMKKQDTNTDSKKIWLDAKKIGNSHDGIINSLLTAIEKVECGLHERVEIENTQNWDNEHTVDYLEAQHIPKGQKVLLCADMNTGKNYHWKNVHVQPWERVVVFVPLRAIVSQQAGTNRFSDPNNRVFTYDQSSKLKEEILKNQIDPTKTTLVFDECHNFLISDYRETALVNLMSSIQEYEWKQIIFQSATINSTDFDAHIQFDNKVRIKKLNEPKHYFEAIRMGSNNFIDYICDFIVHNQHRTLVLWNDSKKLGKLLKKMKREGKTCEIINSKNCKNKQKEAYQMTHEIDYLMTSDALLGTSSIVEGINIQNEEEEVSIIVVGQEHWQHMKQICGRFRKAKFTYTYNISEFKEVIDQPIATVIQEQIEEASKIKNLFLQLNDLKLTHFADFCNLRFNQNSKSSHLGLFFDQKTQEVVQHDFNETWITANVYRQYITQSPEYLMDFMLQQNYQLMPVARRFTLNNLVKPQKKVFKTYKTCKSNALTKMRTLLIENNLDAIFTGLKARGLELTYAHIQMIDPEDLWTEYGPEKHEQELLKLIEYQLRIAPNNKKELIKTAKSWILGNTSIEKLGMYSESFINNHFNSSLRLEYKTGRTLTKSDQCDILKEILNKLINEEKTNTNLSDEQAFKRVMNYDKFKRYERSIIWKDNEVNIKLQKPKCLLEKFLPTTSKSTRINGVKQRVQVVL